MTNEKTNRIRRVIGIMLIIILATTVALFTVSCGWTTRVVKGSGKTITERRSVSDFKKVNLQGVGNIFITQGNDESLIIEADDNLVPLIETDVLDGVLNIRFEKRFIIKPTSPLKFNLTVRDLEGIIISGAGNVYSDEIKTEEMEFKIDGTGDIDLNISAETIEVLSSGAGNIILEGSVINQEITLDGVGKYDGANLESKCCEVNVSGIGSATVNVSEKLDITITGVGDVNYIGNPEITKNISGVGNIKSVD